MTKTRRFALAIAAIKDWHINQIDVFNTFFQGYLFDEIYMQLPQGFLSQGENMVCRLKKSLYGLKQAPRQWNAKLTETLLSFKFNKANMITHYL